MSILWWSFDFKDLLLQLNAVWRFCILYHCDIGHTKIWLLHLYFPLFIYSSFHSDSCLVPHCVTLCIFKPLYFTSLLGFRYGIAELLINPCACMHIMIGLYGIIPVCINNIAVTKLITKFLFLDRFKIIQFTWNIPFNFTDSDWPAGVFSVFLFLFHLQLSLCL